MNRSLQSFFLMTCFLIFSVRADYVPVSDLSAYAEGLNIEGGIVPLSELKGNQIWSNLAVVLDRPIITRESLDKITSKNTFALKEASILSYDEMKVNTAYAAILNYYLLKSRSILNKPDNQPVRIVCQIHRNSSAKNHLDLLIKILEPWFRLNQLVKQDVVTKVPNHLATYSFKETNSILEFRKGFKGDDLKNYEEADVVLGLSLVAGFNESHDSGTLLVPSHFVPYVVKSGELDLSHKYSVYNHLSEVLDDVLSLQSVKMLEQLDSIQSENPLKQKRKAQFLTQSDFYDATLLQADEYFYPRFN